MYVFVYIYVYICIFADLVRLTDLFTSFGFCVQQDILFRADT